MYCSVYIAWDFGKAWWEENGRKNGLATYESGLLNLSVVEGLSLIS